MDEQKEELLAFAAGDSQIPVAVLRKLLDLEADYSDLTIYGAKAQFSRAVAQILDEAAPLTAPSARA